MPSARAPLRDAAAPLALQAFRRLALAHVANNVGDWVAEVALAVLVFDRTHSGLASGGLFLALRFLPALVSPAVVARVEALPARRTLVALHGARVVALAAIALAVRGPLLPVVFVLGAADGLLALCARVMTRASAAALLAPRGQLRAGNALLNMGFTAAAAAGPALAGIAVVRLGVAGALLAAAGALLMAAMGLLRSPLPGGGARASGWNGRMREAIGYVRSRPGLARLLCAEAAVLVFLSSVVPVEVVYAKQSLAAGDAGYGALLTSWGAGMVAGGLAFAMCSRTPLRLLLAASTLAVAGAYVAMAAAGSLELACAAATLGGAGNGVQWVSLVTAVQESTGPRFQARVVGLLEPIATATPGIGFALGAAVATVASPRAAFLVAGGGVVAVTAAAGLPLLRSARRPRYVRGVSASSGAASDSAS